MVSNGIPFARSAVSQWPGGPKSVIAVDRPGFPLHQKIVSLKRNYHSDGGGSRRRSGLSDLRSPRIDRPGKGGPFSTGPFRYQRTLARPPLWALALSATFLPNQLSYRPAEGRVRSALTRDDFSARRHRDRGCTSHVLRSRRIRHDHDRPGPRGIILTNRDSEIRSPLGHDISGTRWSPRRATYARATWPTMFCEDIPGRTNHEFSLLFISCFVLALVLVLVPVRLTLVSNV